jgi:hypothetical protein
MSRVGAGQTVAHELDPDDDREIAIVAATRVRVTPEFLASRIRRITRFKRGDAVLQVGTFSVDPTVTDVATLSLTPDDARRLKGCRRGDCDMQLPAFAMDRLQRVNWQDDAAVDQVNRIVRGMVVDIVRAYQQRGALPTYVDDSQPVDVASEFDELMGSEPRVLSRFPALERHVREYPHDRRADIDDVLYWAKEKIGPREVVTVTHLALWRTGAPPDAFVAASKQLYGSHFFDTSLGITVLAARHAGASDTYVAYMNRSRVDAFGGWLGALKRHFVRSRAKSAANRFLNDLRRRLEQATADVVGGAGRYLDRHCALRLTGREWWPCSPGAIAPAGVARAAESRQEPARRAERHVLPDVSTRPARMDRSR